MALTERQMAFLKALHDYCTTRGASPSLRELNEQISAPLTDHRTVHALMAAGCVTCIPGARRSWHLTSVGRMLVQAYEPAPRRKRGRQPGATLIGASA